MKLHIIILVVVSALLLSCAKDQKNTISLPEPLRSPDDTPIEDFKLPAEQAAPEQATRFKSTPHIVPGYSGPAGASQDGDFSAKGAYQVSVDNLPLPAFINEIYGNMLHVTFEISSVISKSGDLVTLRSGKKLNAAELDYLARQVLENYGVAVQKIGEVYHFSVAKPDALVGEPPLIISGRTLPDVPVTHRPIFQLVPLQVVKAANVTEWINQAYKGHDVKIFSDQPRNAILIMGSPPMVSQVVEAIKIFDQPTMRGRFSERIEPVYLTAADLAEMLQNILSTEGYSVGLSQGGVSENASVFLLPIETVNSLIAFASDKQSLAHIRDWVRTLDQPNELAQKMETTGVYYYNVQNTNAEDLYDVLVDIVANINESGGISVNIDGTQKKTAATAEKKETDESAEKNTGAEQPFKAKMLTNEDIVTPRKGKASKSKKASNGEAGSLVVDKARNALIYQGSRQVWEVLLPIVREMDQAPRMVLIEVTIAEVTLSNEEEFGVEWLLKDYYGSDADGGWVGEYGTLDGLTAGTQGFSYVLNYGGKTRAILNAFAEKSRVTVLSTPRIMVKSGSEATIDVGTDVPTITSQSSGTDDDSKVYQQIQYRRTGTLLTVTPTVHSGRRVDLEISQEVSQTTDSTSSNIDSPNIFTRTIETTLGLKDGGSVLLGGLISTDSSHGYSGVPILSDIPLVGRIFRVEKENDKRTELVMLIIPYIIDDDQDAVQITNSLKSRLTGVVED